MFELKTNYLNHKRVHPHLGVIVNNKKFITPPHRACQYFPQTLPSI